MIALTDNQLAVKTSSVRAAHVTQLLVGQEFPPGIFLDQVYMGNDVQGGCPNG